jgi:acyl-CoA dehydrogenase
MSDAGELRGILADQVERLLGDLSDKRTLENTEEGVWPADLWQAIEENGLTRVLVSEDLGGVGGTWADAEAVIRAAGRHQAPVPLSEGILGGWLLSLAGIPMPDGTLSVAPVRGDESLRVRNEGGDWRLDGTATRVPWGAAANHLAVLAQHDEGLHVALVAAGEWQSAPDSNIAAEPRDTCTFDGATVADIGPLPADFNTGSLFRAGALVRAIQIAGALEFVMAESVQYANDRTQFGRPIGKFQAVQQELARLAGEVAASGAAVEAACRAQDQGDAGFEIAVAKIRASEAASIAASIAHQAHGAIGFTYEHALHFATRRLWSWRAEFGSETRWSEELGRELAGRGADALWPFITDRTSGAANEMS